VSIARLVISRLGQTVAVAWLLVTLCFVFVHALPGDIALRVAKARVGQDDITSTLTADIRAELGLDRPLGEQYLAWLADAGRGDFGSSTVTRKSVVQELLDRGKYTVGLAFIGWMLSYVIALPLGLLAGLSPGGWLDRATAVVAASIASVPAFLIGIVLIWLFAIHFRLLPPAGYRQMIHMVLPAATLALGLAAYSVRVVRNAVVEVRSAFYMTFAELKGIPAAAAFHSHGIRNAAIPVVTFAALQFSYVVDGFVVIEVLFNYPGLGDLVVKSLLARDIPMIMGSSVIIAVLYCVINLIADLCCWWLDPRQREA
jgi:peptide/nickel transport system permease protein